MNEATTLPLHGFNDDMTQRLMAHRTVIAAVWPHLHFVIPPRRYD